MSKFFDRMVKTLFAESASAKEEVVSVDFLPESFPIYVLMYDAKWEALRDSNGRYSMAYRFLGDSAASKYQVCVIEGPGEEVRLTCDKDAVHGKFDNEIRARLMLELQGFTISDEDCLDWLQFTAQDIWWKKTTKAWLLCQVS